MDGQIEPALNPEEDTVIEPQKRAGRDENCRRYEADDDLSVASYGLDVGLVHRAPPYETACGEGWGEEGGEEGGGGGGGGGCEESGVSDENEDDSD